MTAGKNPKTFKKKGQKKKISHPFARKDWYDVKAPVMFDKRNASITPCTRTTGQKIASDSLKGRIFETTLADLNQSSNDQAWRKIKLCVEEVRGKDCLTNFHGMDVTKDKLCQLVRKWQSLIEARVDVKTADGYFLRIFSIGFTARKRYQVKATSYAKNTKIKQIRKKMMEIMAGEAQKSSLKDLVKTFFKEDIEKRITKECSIVYPLQNVCIRKVKVLKKPKFDAGKIQEYYSEAADRSTAAPVATTEEGGKEEAGNLLAK